MSRRRFIVPDMTDQITIQQLAEGLADLTDIIMERLDGMELRLETAENRPDNLSEDLDRLTEYTLNCFEALNRRLDYMDDQSERIETLMASVY